MRLMNRSPIRLSRLLTSFSVRTRIVVLAVIPVVGFLANGLTYISGEHDVASAFSTVSRSGTLTDASRDFKSAVATMRIVAKDFGAAPTKELVADFERAHGMAIASLNVLAKSIEGTGAQKIADLRKDLTELFDNFSQLAIEQLTLGFTDSPGLRQNLRDAGKTVERIINESMTWLADMDAARLMMSLLIMRHQEAEYRLTQTELSRQQFLAAYKSFNTTFTQIDGTPGMKAALERQVKNYADTFEQWIDAYGRVQPLRAIIDIDSQRMRPQADAIIDRARQTADAAAAVLGKNVV